jgi:xanthine dehydrogenase YagS FAD-binding subunit
VNPFEYTSARTADNAASLVAADGRYLAGGIDLLGEMKEYIAQPRRLVNVKELPGTHEITPGKDAWTLGANVTIAEIEQHPELRRRFPGLQQAAAEVGSPQIRNVATLAGNLAQHSRCWYYRHRDIHCAKKGGDTCYARDGENKYHSLFSGNPCISPVVSNLAVALAALDGSVVIRRAGKEIVLTMPEFYQKAWDEVTAHHSLEPADLIVRVQIPDTNRTSAYRQVSEKATFDWALVSCAAAAKVAGRKLSQVRVVLGAVAPVPYQVAAANAFLDGKELTNDVASRAAELILQRAEALAHNAYKIPVAKALIRRTLLQLVG